MAVYFTPADISRIVVNARNVGLDRKPSEIEWQDIGFSVQRSGGPLKLRAANNFPIVALFDENGNRVSPLIKTKNAGEVVSVESENVHKRDGDEIVITTQKGAIVLFGIAGIELENSAPAKIAGRPYVGIFNEVRGAAILCGENEMHCVSLQSSAYGLIELGKVFMEVERYREAEVVFRKAYKQAAGDAVATSEARSELEWALRLQGKLIETNVPHGPSRVAKIE